MLFMQEIYIEKIRKILSFDYKIPYFIYLIYITEFFDLASLRENFNKT